MTSILALWSIIQWRLRKRLDHRSIEYTWRHVDLWVQLGLADETSGWIMMAEVLWKPHDKSFNQLTPDCVLLYVLVFIYLFTYLFTHLFIYSIPKSINRSSNGYRNKQRISSLALCINQRFAFGLHYQSISWQKIENKWPWFWDFLNLWTLFDCWKSLIIQKYFLQVLWNGWCSQAEGPHTEVWFQGYVVVVVVVVLLLLLLLLLLLHFLSSPPPPASSSSSSPSSFFFWHYKFTIWE